MKFGPVPLRDAEGATLAHSVALQKGRLRKGRVLSAEDIAALAAAGVSNVIVARLDPQDIDENTAAARLAQRLRGPGLRMSNAFTGRVNLLADGPGVVMLDRAALEAVNAAHPMITLATVPPFQQMAAGGMVATIKIISYAVPEAALQAACAAAKTDALYLRTPQLRSATLIVTEVDGGAGDKGRAAIEARLNALGVRLTAVVNVPHQAAPLTQEIEKATTDLILILTASATSDIDDVAPAALRRAGGRVERFGMPVDPGNLLFIGEYGERPVIGLPGCARSPALNGADWVLSRVICGIPVSSQDIAAMGVGGLLKEIPTRPQPRNPGKGKR
ncbi:molybdopterin-binding protein [Sulfitobacter sp. S0837]|uniref:molybdopterin-binding protein n=1 Tax=Sulfitobacter maritimus TaxID=2741719 RepID=UPI0015826F37|nr:molybdopterin-binding protein [Sulfitobacter maritimus]NUH64529.1 molybdopterin-binding protein [Sulfitobacter maritimus]